MNEDVVCNVLLCPVSFLSFIDELFHSSKKLVGLNISGQRSSLSSNFSIFLPLP